MRLRFFANDIRQHRLNLSYRRSYFLTHVHMYTQLIYCDLSPALLKLRPKALYKCDCYEYYLYIFYTPGSVDPRN